MKIVIIILFKETDVKVNSSQCVFPVLRLHDTATKELTNVCYSEH